MCHVETSIRGAILENLWQLFSPTLPALLMAKLHFCVFQMEIFGDENIDLVVNYARIRAKRTRGQYVEIEKRRRRAPSSPSFESFYLIILYSVRESEDSGRAGDISLSSLRSIKFYRFK